MINKLFRITVNIFEKQIILNLIVLKKDFYTNSITKNRSSTVKRKRQRISKIEIQEMRKYFMIKSQLTQVYNKSGSYEIRKLSHKPQNFENRITSFQPNTKFIATANMNGDVQVKF